MSNRMNRKAAGFCGFFVIRTKYEKAEEEVKNSQQESISWNQNKISLKSYPY